MERENPGHLEKSCRPCFGLTDCVHRHSSRAFQKKRPQGHCYENLWVPTATFRTRGTANTFGRGDAQTSPRKRGLEVLTGKSVRRGETEILSPNQEHSTRWDAELSEGRPPWGAHGRGHNVHAVAKRRSSSLPEGKRTKAPQLVPLERGKGWRRHWLPGLEKRQATPAV